MLATATRPLSADRPWVTLPPQSSALLAKVLKLKIQDSGLRFQCDGEECTAEVGLPDGLLPMLVWEASQFVQTLWGKAPPVTFQVDEKALLGVTVDFSEPTESVGMWALYLDYVLDRHVKDWHLRQKTNPTSDVNPMIPLDEAFQQWVKAQDANELPIRARPPLPEPGPRRY